MKKMKFLVVFSLSTLFILTSLIHVHAQEAEIDKIIQDVSANSQEGAISNYTYLMKFTYDQRRKFAAKKITRLYEAILPSRYSPIKIYRHQYVLLEDSERNISALEIMNARREIAKKLEKDETDADLQTPQNKLEEDGGYWTFLFSSSGRSVRIDVLQLLKNAVFTNLKHQQIGGKPVAVMDFAPKPEVVLGDATAYLGKIEGRITIDETDKRVIRVEGFAPGEYAKFRDKTDAERQPETVFLFSQTKVAEGYWFPQYIHLNFAKLPKGFDPIDLQFSFINYNRARVEVNEPVETQKIPANSSTKEKNPSGKQ